MRFKLLRAFRGNWLAVGCAVIAVLCIAGGAGSLAAGFRDQRSVPSVKDVGSISLKPARPAASFLPFSQPSTIDVDSIGIHSPLITVGKTTTGAIDVPAAPHFDEAAWFRDSPSPGQYGVSVIVGHVDSYANNDGASVFYNLPKAKPGDTVRITRSDKTVASFKVYAIRQYDKATLPSGEVYAAHDQDSELRLITCSGPFDKASGTYRDNTVIFASFDGSQPTASKQQ
jgi:hypothetical protein